MEKTLKEIAKLINGEVIGDDSIIVTGVAGIKEAKKGDITFLANPKYLPLLDKTQASAIITSRDITKATKPIIRTDNASLAFTKVISSLLPYQAGHPKGMHPTCLIGKDAKLGKNIALGPYTVIEDEVCIGDNTIIYANCYIGLRTKIGSDSLIYPHVSIREHITVGSRVIIHSGTVIGSDGFGYVTVSGKHHKIPQSGTVEIGDDVEIGANVTVDRARFEKTIIGSGTKIDNLVHIAHNVVIGQNCFIVAQVGISGSTIIGDSVTLAGQAGLAGHITIGDNAVIAARAGVTKSVPANTTVSGYPAKPHNVAKKINAYIQNLPRLYEHITKLKKKIEELELKLKNK